MENVKVVIENFKGVKRVELGPIKPINVLIGRNNSGKSSVLTCIDLLSKYLSAQRENVWGENTYSNERVDTSIPKDYFSKNGKPIKVSVEFCINDDQRRQNLFECINMSVGRLISQKFSTKVVKELLEEDFFKRQALVFSASHPKSGFSLSESYTFFKNEKILITKGGVGVHKLNNFMILLDSSNQIKDIDERMECMRKPVKEWHYESDDNLGFISEILVKPKYEQIKQFWNSSFLVSPFRHCLEAEKPQLTEQLEDNGVNLVRYLHNLALNEHQVFEEIAEFVKKVLPEVGRLHPRFTGKEDHSLELAYDWNDGHSVNLANMGGGVEQLLIFASLLIKQRTSLILWEEPESHLHPAAQDVLIDLMEKHVEDSCIFLTTHSPVFIRPSDNIAIHAIKNIDGKSAIGNTLSKEDLIEACDLIGSRPGHLAQADIVVYVEGKSGAAVIEEWIEKWPEKQDKLKHLQLVVQSFNISEVGGDGFDIDKIKKVNSNLVFFVDNDADEEKGESIGPDRQKLKDICKEDIPCVVTDYEKGIRQIEDYFTIEALQKGLPSCLAKTVKDDGEPVRRKMGKNWKKHNRRIARAMDWSDIEKHNDLKVFFGEIEKIATKLLPN